MSAETPNERKNIAADAVQEFLKQHPDWVAKPKDDLTVLFESFDAKCRGVNTLMQPIIESALTSSSIHTVVGRRDFMLAAHKRFVEAFHGYNKEELLFLLAWTHANMLTASHA